MVMLEIQLCGHWPDCIKAEMNASAVQVLLRLFTI